MANLKTTVGSVEEMYADYRRFLRQFHEASGPRRDPMNLEAFSKWWEKLRESDRANYLASYKAGYKELDENSAEVELVRRRRQRPSTSGASANSR